MSPNDYWLLHLSVGNIDVIPGDYPDITIIIQAFTWNLIQITYLEAQYDIPIWVNT